MSLLSSLWYDLSLDGISHLSHDPLFITSAAAKSLGKRA
jgi:hypothetical protein